MKIVKELRQKNLNVQNNKRVLKFDKLSYLGFEPLLYNFFHS